MAFSQKAIFLFFLVATAILSMAAASDRQPLFSKDYSSSRQLPMRFQEMIRRRKLAQSGGYGTPAPTTRPPTPVPTTRPPAPTPPATTRPPATPAPTPRPPTTTTVVTPVRYGVTGTYGIYGR